MRPNIEEIRERWSWSEYVPTVIKPIEDVMKLLAYIDELESMPLVQTVVKLQEEYERLKSRLSIAEEVIRMEGEI